MKKSIATVILISFIVSLFSLFGCGPKYASQETMDELEEAREACASVKAEVKDLEEEIENLKKEKAAKEEKVAELEKQLEKLEGK